MAGGKQQPKNKHSSSVSQDIDTVANQTIHTPTKRQKRGANNQHDITNNNQASLTEPLLSVGTTTNNTILVDGSAVSASAYIAADSESNNKAATNMVNESASVEAPADITIEQTLPIEEQLAVSTYQISVFLNLFLCYSIFHRVHCVFFKI